MRLTEDEMFSLIDGFSLWLEDQLGSDIIVRETMKEWHVERLGSPAVRRSRKGTKVDLDAE